MAGQEAAALLAGAADEYCDHDRADVCRADQGDGSVEWVNVARGARVGDLIEVFGALKEGDTIARRGTDELRQGSKVKIQAPKAS